MSHVNTSPFRLPKTQTVETVTVRLPDGSIVQRPADQLLKRPTPPRSRRAGAAGLGLALLVCALLCARSAAAQTPSYKVAWDQADILPANIATVIYTLKIDSGTPIPLTPTCTAKGSGSTCTAPLTSYTAGTHTLVLTVTDAGGQSSSAPFSTTAPGQPAGLTIVVTISIP